MRKRIIGIIVFGTSLLLAGCGSRGEVKRDAGGKQVLSGYITLSGAFALYPLAIQWADEFHRLHPDVDIDIRQVEPERVSPMCLPTRWILPW